ncbi:MAG TPA: KpsF/GutQ family sugar-phosphate isomerase [bacterium]|nr:KpsF/GutQ family sugar-phosphate isomerase [bacterium]
MERARRVLKIEADAIMAMAERLDANFEKAVNILLACEGKVVVIGMGKSGLVGNKIAATMASTGTPAFFMHAAEALHGDLGMVHKTDVAIIVSNSGETEEVLALLPALRRQGLPIIALTGGVGSNLARTADAVLDTSVAEEACPLGLAPTASTTAQLAMGDALAVALLEEHGFSQKDFARFHPAGRLGKRLLMRVSDLMHSGDDLPRVQPDTPVMQVLMEMSAKRLGITAVEDEHGALLGVITDGDLRRALQKFSDLSSRTAVELMTSAPKTIHPDALASRAAHVMDKNSISVVLVRDQETDKIVGMLHLHDLLHAGII